MNKLNPVSYTHLDVYKRQVFLTEVSNKKLSAVVQPAGELLAAIPSVIYGLLGLMILNPVLYKLEKFFKPDTDVYVTLSVEKDRQKIEVTIPAKGHVIRSEQVSNCLLYTSRQSEMWAML